MPRDPEEWKDDGVLRKRKEGREKEEIAAQSDREGVQKKKRDLVRVVGRAGVTVV